MKNINLHLDIPVVVYGESALPDIQTYLSSVITERNQCGPGTHLCFNGDLFMHALETVLNGLVASKLAESVYVGHDFDTMARIKVSITLNE